MFIESEYPDEFANILFDAAICLGQIKTIVARNHILEAYNFPQYSFRFGSKLNNHLSRFTSFKEFFNKRNISYKGYYPEQFSKYSDEFYSRMDNAAEDFAVDFFIDLYRDFKELSVEELIKIRELGEPVPDIIKSFMPQREILEKIRIETSIGYRHAQDKFLGDLNGAIQSYISAKETTPTHRLNKEYQKLSRIFRKFILGDFRFRIIQTISYPGDYPYTNWLDNIPDLMLNYFNCCINMINTLIQMPERLERERLEREEIEKRRQKNKRLESIAKKKTRSQSLRLLREEKGEVLQIKHQSQYKGLHEIDRIKERVNTLRKKRRSQLKNNMKDTTVGKKVKGTRKYNK